MTDLRQRLKAETSQIHKDVESLLSFHNMDKQEYGQLLQKFYRFHSGFEKSVLSFMDHSVFSNFNWPSRQKLKWLKQDLQVLGINDPDENSLENLDIGITFQNAYEVLGAFYVLEGSTLGGQVISGMLQEKFSMNSETGSRFFSGYQEQTGIMWRKFLSLIEGHTLEQSEFILEGAKKTFLAVFKALH